MEKLSLENEYLRLECLPEIGGKISSILFQENAQELLWQPKLAYQIPTFGGDFSKYDRSGIDECFPNIDVETIQWEGKEYEMLDHGEIWCQSWEMEKRDSAIFGKVNGRTWNFSFERKISLAGNQIRFDYAITNHEAFAIPAFWTFHPLFACTEDSKIDLQGARKVELAHSDLILGPMETVLGFPLAKGSDLSRIRPFSSQTSRKFYSFDVHQSGKATVSLGKTLVSLSFNPELVPYLGVWINEGGKNNEYNLAVEPSTGYYDKVSIALRKGKLRKITAGERFEFSLTMEIQQMD